MPLDHIGIGWRWQLAPRILEHLDEIDVLEVVAEHYLRASRREIASIRALARARPLHIHSVSLGLASSWPVEHRRVDRLARLVNTVEPIGWSEHLACVRANGIEIGHMAPTPRTQSTIDGTAANVACARRVIGSAPALENIASLIDAPMSDMDEAEWITRTLRSSDCSLLLDLHNLYANACNFSQSPEQLLASIPLERVVLVHLSGGKWIREPGSVERMRLLDDHVHAVPDEVFELLTLIASRTPRRLTVILERDGNFPVFDELLSELRRAREAVARGRQLARIAA
jgi:uncharacterized protein (UPF0276 family)